MSYGLMMDDFPKYLYSAYKTFSPGEKHVCRVCQENVLILMLEGTLFFDEDGVPVAVSQGEYYIQKSGLRQAGILPSSGARYYYIHFYGAFGAGSNTLPLRGDLNATALLPLFSQLESMQMLPRPLVEKSAVFYQILSLLNRRNTSTGYKKIVEQAVSVISQNLQTPCSLDTLAARCGYSKNHIIHVFKAETGLTPYAYIQKLRIDNAKRLLDYSSLSASEIAVECGFGSYINLYKEFHKSEGCSPLQWRSRMMVP